jgi:hypothetical protein
MKGRIRDLSVIGSIVFFLVTVPIDIYIELGFILSAGCICLCIKQNDMAGISGYWNCIY